MRKKLKRHKNRAYDNVHALSSSQTSYQVKKFQLFQDQTGSEAPGHSAKNNAEIFENFCWWLQRCTEVHCNYKGAQSFLRVISRHYDISAEPFVAWEIAKFREFKKAFNDLALLAPRVNLAFDRKVAAYLLKTLAKGKKLNDKTLQCNAMLLYLVTSLRAGNVLLGSGDSDKTLTLKMGNVFEQKGSTNSVPCMFIYNDRHKNSKRKPVLTAVPFNELSLSPAVDCAATILRNAWLARRADNAADNESVFINKRSKKPLSTAVANARIQCILKEYFEARSKPGNWSKLYTLKSARKAVASHMKTLGCSPQTIALQLKHSTLSAQMSYICRFFKDKPGLTRALYKDL